MQFKYKTPRYVPVVFYDLSGYDVHLLIRELGKKLDSGSISMVALMLMSLWVGTRICGVGLTLFRLGYFVIV